MITDSPTTLAHLAVRAGIDVLDHLDKQVHVPVISGIQAQGDLIVIPADLVPEVRTFADRPFEVRGAGIELLRSESGGNPHVLVSDVGLCRWNPQVRDSFRLALGLLETTVTAYLIHPEHGATGMAPGRYVIRRQRDRSGRNGYVVD
ncbi:hypothetical protein JVX90_04950 [Gordonia sp. PDNC005]|uniref:hypothetical protein n=1 Tax=unclassified Gordonia (in: high G+C Gram-positive bacteria) TaxID=2657482 RepID=UPI0019648267|nr:hypothetical protein [Gordonia sp. PDNC005]QRY63575.1 hypothetical protein JVX90_04950 [Gordonia sp. PDNC005]